MLFRLPLAYIVAGTTAILATLSTVSPGGAQGKLTAGGTSAVTTGTTGLGGGFTSSGNTIFISDLIEHVSASTYGYFSGSWQQLTGRHTAGIQFTSAPWSLSSPPAPNVASVTHTESVFVEQGTEMGVPSGTSMGGGTATGGVSVYGGSVSSGNNFYVQTSDTGAIPSGRHLVYWVRVDTSTTYNDGTPPSGGTSWGRVEKVLVKLGCEDASIDTRKTYGQPNKGGELPADANAPLREVNFGPWDYKGGIFIGNIPSTASDASGTSRLQLYVQGGSTYASTYEFASLSLLDRGKPSDSTVAGNIDTGIYFPSSSDTNLSVGEGSVTWSSKWSITPGAVDTMSSDWTQHPFVHKTLTNGDSGDYISFPLCSAAGTTKPAMGLYDICVAIVSEQDAIDFGSKCWHYFASREYEDSGAAFPRSDCAPRVWLITAP